MGWSDHAWIGLFLVATQVLGVRADKNSDMIGFIVAGIISFFLLSVVITFVVISFTCKNTCYDLWLRKRGQVRMPREYFRKKKEAKRRLLAESANQSVKSTQSAGGHHAGQTVQPTQSVVNGGPPRQMVDRASWVQGWNQSASPRGMETLDATMVLGDEQEDEFKIETILVDNEVLDVGPYKTSHTNEQPVKGDVYSDPYIFSAGDTAIVGIPNQQTTKANSSSTPRDTTAITNTPSGEMIEVTDSNNFVYSTVAETQNVPDMIRL